MLVLGFETSCDDTAVALYDSDRGLLAHRVYSQLLHAEYGGVIPELAARDHIRKIMPLVEQVFLEAQVEKSALNAVAYTAGPGLIGAVMVGATVAKSIALGLNIPSLGIHHLEGHLLSPLLENPKPDFPFLALLVSGAHTQIISVEKFGSYKILGESLDDAAGEAFDKVGKLLDLDYPAGPALSKLAELGNSGRFVLPRPMTQQPGLNFSFSGLKTAVRDLVMSLGDVTDVDRADIAQAFQEAVVETLVMRCRRALKETMMTRLVVAGGVSANRLLRQELTRLMHHVQGDVYFPRQEFCTDNAAMIAYVGCLRLMAGQREGLEINLHARWGLEAIVSE